MSSIADFLRRPIGLWRAANPWAKFLGKLALTVALLGLVVHGLELEKIAESFRRLHPAAVAGGALAGAAFVAIRVGKWALLIRANGLTVPFPSLAKAMLYSLVLGIVTPGRMGEMVSVAPFPPERRKQGIVLFFFDRLGEVGTVLALSIPAAAWFAGGWGAALGLVLLAPLAGTIILFDRRQFWRGLARRFSLGRWEFLDALHGASLRATGRYWAASFAGQAVAYLTVACFILGAVNVDDWRFIALLPVVSLSNLISVTVGGLGIREGFAALLMPLAGVPAEIGAVAFLLAFVVTRVVPGIIGAIWFAGGDATVL